MSSTNKYISNQPPPLPTHGVNPHLVNYRGKLKSVRTQAITLGPTSTITIARIKIPSPDKTLSHLIKRFDTNAISATSFFKGAFPNASEEDEEIQMKYINQIYDTHTAGALGLGPDHRLTGVWVPIEHAAELAEAFGLTLFATPLINFPEPEPKPAVEPSPTTVKKEAEQQNEPPNQPTPKGRSNQQSKIAVDQTPTSVRSTKRSKVAPPSFGNTSPSNFNLSSLNKSNIDSKKINTQNVSGVGTVPESVPTSASTNQTVSSTNSVDDPSQRNKTTTHEAEDDPHADAQNVDKSKKHVEKSSSNQQSQQKLMGTEEEVTQAKEEARKLVSSLKSSSSTCPPPEKSPTDSTVDDNNQTTSSTKTKESTATVNRKRSLDEVLEEEEDTSSKATSSNSLSRSSFLRRSFWGRSKQSSDGLKKRVIHSKKDGSIAATQSSIDNNESLMDSSKRNLAIAGIVIAGAAASIVPYFF